MDRLVARDDVGRLMKLLDVDDPRSLLRAFLLVQAWGAGVTGGRTLRHTRAALSDTDHLLESLKRTAGILREAGPNDSVALERAYRDWRVRSVGRSFFTKWFAFAGRVDGRQWQPLILDARVLATLNKTLQVSTRDLAGTRLWPARYRGYVEAVHRWAEQVPAELGHVGPERLEWILFANNGASVDAGPTRDQAPV